jgi:hypothetical protein
MMIPAPTMVGVATHFGALGRLSATQAAAPEAPAALCTHLIHPPCSPHLHSCTSHLTSDRHADSRYACSPALPHHTLHAPLTPSAAATSSQRAWRCRARAHAQPHLTRPHPPRSHAHCASCAPSASLLTMPPRPCLVPVLLLTTLELHASPCCLTPPRARALAFVASSIARCGRHLVLTLRCLLLLLLLLLRI